MSKPQVEVACGDDKTPMPFWLRRCDEKKFLTPLRSNPGYSVTLLTAIPGI
jgi:hypothetical protein